MFLLGHSLGNARRNMLPPIPQSSSFTIPEIYAKDYLNRDRLLLHDNTDPKFQSDVTSDIHPSGRILIWSSDIQLNLLFNSQRLHMDGTFSTSPKSFEQVFIIQAIHHGTCKLSIYPKLLNSKVPYINELSFIS